MNFVDKIKNISSDLYWFFNKPKKDKYGFSATKLSLEKLTKWVNITTLVESPPIDTSNSLPFFFGHLEDDLGVSEDQEILGLWIDYPNIEIEDIIENFYLYNNNNEKNQISVHRILFNKEIVGFMTGKGKLYRDEFFTIYDNVAYRKMLQFIRDTYDNVPNVKYQS